MREGKRGGLGRLINGRPMLRTYLMYAAGCIATPYNTHIVTAPIWKGLRATGRLKRKGNSGIFGMMEMQKTTGPDWPIKTEKRSLGRVFVPGATCMRNPCSLATPLFFSFCCASICMSACHPPGCLLAPAARLLNCVCVCVCVVHQTHLPTYHPNSQNSQNSLPLQATRGFKLTSYRYPHLA